MVAILPQKFGSASPVSDFEKLSTCANSGYQATLSGGGVAWGRGYCSNVKSTSGSEVAYMALVHSFLDRGVHMTSCSVLDYLYHLQLFVSLCTPV